MSFVLALLISATAFGGEISETFSSRSTFVSGTAIWNHALGVVHPTLQVMNYKAGFTPLAVDVGDGSHGSFDVSTYANFSVGGDISGNIIRLDLAAYPILKVTNFHLAAGWTIQPVGDQPVIIYSLSDVTIEGEIHCQGANGANAVGTARGLGGQGRCGGADGGDGGLQFGSGSAGGNASAGVTGGGGGVDSNAGATVGGGGGGGWNNTSAAGDGVNASGPNGGLGGDNVSDPEFTQLIGGAGGGGGGGSDAHAGAGGGGGGAGGAVKVFVGRTINIYNTGAASQAGGGTGGTNSLAVASANGASGRSWFSSVNYVSTTGFYTPAEELPVSPGNVEFNAASQNVVTSAVDLFQSRAVVDALTVSPASADFTLEASGSDDGFVSDDTGWTTSLSSLSGKRYLKLRLSIATSDVNNPTMADSATLSYTSTQITEFNMKAAGCASVARAAGESGSSGARALIPFLILLVFLGGLILCARRVPHRS